MPRNRKMIYIGRENLERILSEIEMPKGMIGEIIGLTKGGFWHVTHVSGRMNIDTLDKLKSLYEEQTGKKLNIENEFNFDFSNIPDIELAKELTRRGWKVTCPSPE